MSLQRVGDNGGIGASAEPKTGKRAGQRLMNRLGKFSSYYIPHNRGEGEESSWAAGLERIWEKLGGEKGRPRRGERVQDVPRV
jgi:hypothetical protein